MPTLFETINQRLSEQRPEEEGPELGQEQISKVLAAKGGQAGGGAGIGSSQLGAEAVRAQARQQKADIALGGAVAGAELASAKAAQEAQTAAAARGIEQRGDLARTGMQTQSVQAAESLAAASDQARAKRTAEENMRIDSLKGAATKQLRDLEASRGLALDDIFSEFKQSNQELEYRADMADLEQLGFQLALSDQTYLDELNRIGKERNLNNQQTFESELHNLVLGDNLQAELDNIEFTRALNSKQREWEVKLQKMGANQAVSLAQAMIKDDQRRSMIEGIGSAVGAGASAVAKYGMPSFGGGGTPDTAGGGGGGGPSQPPADAGTML